MKLYLHHICNRQFPSKVEFLSFVHDNLLYNTDEFPLVSYDTHRQAQYIRIAPDDIPEGGTFWLSDFSAPHNQHWVAERHRDGILDLLRRRYLNDSHAKVITLKDDDHQVEVALAYVSPKGDVVSLIGIKWVCDPVFNQPVTTICQMAETDEYNIQANTLWLYDLLQVDYATASQEDWQNEQWYVSNDSHWDRYWWESTAQYYIRTKKFHILVQDLEYYVPDDAELHNPENLALYFSDPSYSMGPDNWCWEAFSLLTQQQQVAICQEVLTYHEMVSRLNQI